MPRIQYQTRRLRHATLCVIGRANEIIDEFAAQGFDLTLRQLYYQFVARGFIANEERQYKRLGSIVNDARLCGLMDWDRIVDRTRRHLANAHWANPGSVVASAAESYANDKWADQPFRVEVWIEKNALIQVVAGACEVLDVGHFACVGYTSQSAMWRAARRLLRYERRGQSTLIVHLGDHDPSGIDMTRDIEDRLRVFGSRVRVERVALNMDQIEEQNPPPNPAKVTDSRFEHYLAQYGSKSWELDALDPAFLSELVREAVVDLRDDGLWNDALEREEADRKNLDAAARRWGEVSAFLNEKGTV